jgi:hypothetical protein
MLIGFRNHLTRQIPLSGDSADDGYFVMSSGLVGFFLPMAIYILPAYESFIYLDFSHEFRETFILHCRSDAVTHIPSGSIVSAPDLPMNLQSADTLLALRHQVNHLEPSTERIVGVLENGLGYDGEAIAVFTAAILVLADPVKRASFKLIYLCAVAAGAMDAIRPAQSLEETFTGFLRGKPFRHLGQGHRGLCCLHEG